LRSLARVSRPQAEAALIAGIEGERWPSRLVATASENRLSIRRNLHTFAAVSDCRAIAIYEYSP
jgi:hypothetical protein